MRTFETLYWLSASTETIFQSIYTYEARFRYATAALIVIEMLLDKNIQWNDKQQLIGLPNPPKHQLMRDIWEACTIPKKIKWYWQTGKKQDTAITLKDWLDVIAVGKFKIFESIKENLITQDVLKVINKRIIGIPYKKTIITSPEQRLAYQNTLQDIVLEKEKTNIHNFILLKVIKVCKLNTLIYNPNNTKARNQFITELDKWANQKFDYEHIITFLEGVDFDKNLDDLMDMLDAILEIVDSIGDFTGDDGSDGGDGGSD